MKIDGSMIVSAPREKLWQLLQEPEFLQEVMPGCKKLEQTGEDEYIGVVSARIGPIASQYTTKFSILNKRAPESYRLHLEGEGKGGFVRADIQIALSEAEDGTQLGYSGEVMIGGTVARIGQRVIDSASKMLINQGFKALRKKVEERQGND